MAWGHEERITREDMAVWPACHRADIAKHEAYQELVAEVMEVYVDIELTNSRVDPYDAPIPPSKMPIDPMGRE